MFILYTILIVFVAFVALLAFIYITVRIILNKTGFKDYSLSKLYNEIKKAREENEIKHKQVTGMTKVLLPTILSDFPDFNELQFYTKTEEHLRKILASLEDLNIEYLASDDYELIRDKIDFQIRDLAEKGIVYKYDDIIFHKHAIKSYQKTKGMVKLDISTSLEYYYEKVENGVVEKSSKKKKQTRYVTSYVYIYDTKAAGFDVKVLGLNCPNCGSPIAKFENGVCPYCGSGLNIRVADILKCWKIINIKEDC